MNNDIADAVPMPEPTPKRLTQRKLRGVQQQRRINAQSQLPAEGTPPTIPVNVSKTPEFFRSQGPNHTNLTTVHFRRTTLYREIGLLTQPALQRFVQVLFSDDLVVNSYFSPKQINGRVGRAFEEGVCLVEALPWREAKRASIKAALTNCLFAFPQEREIVSVAAWALPAGLFVISHNKKQAKGDELRDWDWKQAREVTAGIVRNAIEAMHAINAQQSCVMNALIGQGGFEGCQPEQLSRLGVALYLSQNRINDQWVPVTAWMKQGRDDSDRAEFEC